MLGARSRFAKFVRDLTPEATSVHCLVHRQALAQNPCEYDYINVV